MSKLIIDGVDTIIFQLDFQIYLKKIKSLRSCYYKLFNYGGFIDNRSVTAFIGIVPLTKYNNLSVLLNKIKYSYTVTNITEDVIQNKIDLNRFQPHAQEIRYFGLVDTIERAIQNPEPLIPERYILNELIDDDLGFWTTRLSPKETALPMHIYPSGLPLKKKPVLFVNPNYDKRMSWTPFQVTITDNPRINGNHGYITHTDILKLKYFVELNLQELLDHWNGKTDSVDLLKSMKKFNNSGQVNKAELRLGSG